MKKIFYILLLTIFANSMNAQISSSYVENELIIWLEQGVDAEEFATNSSQGIIPKRLLSERLNIWLFEFINTGVVAQRTSVINNLSLSNNVKHIQNNHYVTSRAIIPNDDYYNQQWAPTTIRLPDVWDEFTTGGSSTDGDNIVVAIIDGGFDLNHEDLNFWKNTNEIPNNGLDDDNNGYIDDFDGWNAYNHTGTIPNNNHGTHVAGIVGAIGNNSTGVSGVNWNVGVLPIAGSSGSEATVVEAYSYVLEMRSLYNETNGQLGAFIVATNSSFGVDLGSPANFPIWCSMYDELGKVGILNCAATANANWDIDQVGDVPTTCPSNFLIAVTNTTSTDNKYSGAGYGAVHIDIGAPGTNIYSTLPDNNYGSLTGTSMATPHVAGVIALMYASMPQNEVQEYKSDPENFALLVRQYLLDGADRISSLNGLVSSGRLNAYESVKLTFPLALSGPSTICTTPATYTLSPGTVTTWTIQPTSAFSITSQNATSATVQALSYAGTQGTLTAIAGGTTITKTIVTCNIAIEGASTVCLDNITYTIPAGTATWSVAPASAFSIANSGGTWAEVQATAYNGAQGTLTATINGVAVKKTIRTCSIPISGAATVCSDNITYTIPAGTATWSVAPASVFSIIASDATSATVKALSYAGTQGTLTATINGVAVTKPVRTCSIAITGEATVCPSAVYTLSNSMATVTSWSITPDDVFSISSGGNAATVTASYTNGASATVTAVVNGITLTKTIQACAPAIDGPEGICPVEGSFDIFSGSSSTAIDITTGDVITTVNSYFYPDTATYVLTIDAEASTWTVTPPFTIIAFDATSASVTVTPTRAISQYGTLAAVVDGDTISKNIYSCPLTIVCSAGEWESLLDLQRRGTYTLNYIPDYIDEAYWSTSEELEVVEDNGLDGCVVNVLAIGAPLPFSASATATIFMEFVSQNGNVHTIQKNEQRPTVLTSITAKRYSNNNTVTSFIDGQQYYFTASPLFAKIGWPSNAQCRWYYSTARYPTFIGSLTGCTTTPITADAGSTAYPNFSYNVLLEVYTDEWLFPSAFITANYPVSAGVTSFSANIYPNPASSILYIETSGAVLATSTSVFRVKLVAASTGAVALNQIVSSFNGTLQFNISNVPDGLYSVILMRDNTLLHSETILIQH